MQDSRIWILLLKQLCGEATGGDMQELKRLLAENPVLITQLDILLVNRENNHLAYPHADETAFGRLLEKIKEMNGKEGRVTKKDRGMKPAGRSLYLQP